MATTRKSVTKASPARKVPSRSPRSRRPEPPPKKRPVVLHEISARAFEHPAEAAALAALRRVPGFDFVLKRLFALVGDRALRVAFQGSAVRVSPHQFPEVWAEYVKAAQILDMSPLPELFVAQTPFVNAGAVGLAKPLIVLNSGSLDLFDGDELRYILGHELGHVLGQRVLYKTMLRVILRISQAAFSVPLGGAALFAISAALLEWDRKSELSADRAGLLAVQDVDVAYRAQMKMAGGGRTNEMNLAAFAEQAREYEAGGSVLDSVWKLIQLSGTTHPFPVIRLAELRKWAESGAYDAIVSGDYPRRADDKAEPSFVDEVKKTAGSYKESFETSGDPLVSFVRGMVAEVKRRAGGS